MLLLCLGQKQKCAADIMQLEGKLCQIPSFNSMMALRVSRVRLKSTQTAILLVILTKISHERAPSSRHRDSLRSRMSTKSMSFLMEMGSALSQESSLEALSSISTSFPFILKRENARIQSSFLSNQNMKSFDFEGERASQLVTVGFRRCLDQLVEAIRVKWLKYFSFEITLTTETVNYKAQISSFLNQRKPSVLCSTFYKSFFGSIVLATNNFKALRGATRLKVTSFFCSSLNLKSTLSSPSSIVQLKAVPSDSSTSWLPSITVIQNSVFSRPQTFKRRSSSSLGSQMKGWWKLLVLNLQRGPGT